MKKKIIISILISSFIFISTVSNIWAKNINKIYKLGVWNNANTAIVSEDRAISGFEPELFLEISNYLPFETEILSFENKKECLEALSNQEIDVAMSSLYSEDIANQFEYSELMVRHVDAVLVSYNRDYTYQEYGLMKNKRIAYLDRGEIIQPVLDYLNDKIENPEFVPFNTVKEIREALYNGEIDLGTFGIGALEDSLDILDRFYALPTYYITRKNESSIINNALSQYLSSSYTEYSRLYYKYYPRAITTELTREEINYINSNIELNACTVRDKNVFSSLSNEGDIIGIFPDIIRSINSISGLNINLKITSKNTTLQQLVSNKECEIAIGLDSLKSVENEDDYIYCDSIMKIPMELIIKKGKTLIKRETNKIVLTREGCISDVYVKENYPNWIIKYEPNLEKRYEMLLKGEVDCLLDSSYSYNYLSAKEQNKVLTRYPITLFNSNLNIIVQKDNPIVANIINKALIQIKKENLEKIIEYNISNITYKKTLFDSFLSNRVEYLLTALLIFIFFFILYFWGNKRKQMQLEIYNENLLEAEKKANEANNAKSIFLARMSHDMRTPLGAVIALSNFGVNEDKDEKMKSYFNDINNSSTYLLSLIDDILDSQKLQSNSFELTYESVNYCKIIKRVLSIVDIKLKEKDINLELIKLCKNIKSNIYADEKRLSQIYLNILNNAIKYTHKGGSIYWENSFEYISNNKVRITSIISDTGVGMSEDFLKNKLFSPFSKEENELSKNEGGSGLGLNICKNLISQMNGEISCESILSKGTTFIISIDFELITEVKEEDKIIERIDEEDKVFKNKKILVCDDTEINLKIAKKILEKKLIIVDIAYNGEEAVKKVCTNKYDAILMDIRMPIMDGIEATKRIRCFDKQIPIFAFSANAYKEDIELSLKSGMNEHFAKPIDTYKLFKTLKIYFSEKEN